MTFGSNIPFLPLPVAEKFIVAFRQLRNHKVIWRLDNRDNLTLSDNVMAVKWLPQSDLLADPRVKLFITHCGLNGLFESIYNGVPMLGFPLSAEQPSNAKTMEHKGYGLRMNIRDFTSEELLKNIQKILQDPLYSRAVRLASDIFKSAPMS